MTCCRLQFVALFQYHNVIVIVCCRTMGISKSLFKEGTSSSILEQFECSLCKDVAEDPKLTLCCESMVCSACHTNTLLKEGNYFIPNCDSEHNVDLVDMQRLLRKLYSKLIVKCLNEGCTETVTVMSHREHELNCSFRRCTICEVKDVHQDHNCIESLKRENTLLQNELSGLRDELMQVRNQELAAVLEAEELKARIPKSKSGGESNVNGDGLVLREADIIKQAAGQTSSNVTGAQRFRGRTYVSSSVVTNKAISPRRNSTNNKVPSPIKPPAINGNSLPNGNSSSNLPPIQRFRFNEEETTATSSIRELVKNGVMSCHQNGQINQTKLHKILRDMTQKKWIVQPKNMIDLTKCTIPEHSFCSFKFYDSEMVAFEA